MAVSYSERSVVDAGALSECAPGTDLALMTLGGSSQLVSRLYALGLIPGVRIQVIRSGNPIVIRIGETRLCLRKEDAAAIRVQTVH